MTLTLTPSAGFRVLLLLLMLSPGVSAGEETTQQANPADPYEDWNRSVFRFNTFVDNWFLRPVAQGYRAIMPTFADRAVTNFFSNLTEIRNFTGSVLQLKGESAVVALGRFTYNTVFGLGGLFDVASAWDLPEQEEDFGQVLGYWGLDSGPYLMLPFLGPSTVRDFGGFTVDVVVVPGLGELTDEPNIYYLYGLKVVDKRADLIPAENFISGDKYTFVRNAYLQRRAYLINDGGPVKDPFAQDNGDDVMLKDF